jgi:hypothetical protein
MHTATCSYSARWERIRRIALPSLIAVSLLAPATASFAKPEVETPPPVSGRRLSAPESIVAADVLARVELIRANVEILRLYMGKSAAPPPLLQVGSARPSEVYSQALNLQLRANRLAFEQVRVVRNPSIPINRQARPADVFAVVDSALATVMMVKREFEIESAVAEEIQPESSTPSNVFDATIAASTEIDHLLELRTSPSDVYQLVTAAVHTAAAVHATLPNGRNLPSEPAFEPNKMPADVFERLRRCFDLISQIAQARGLHALEFEITESGGSQISPGDVSDMASLVAEELTNLHRSFQQARTPARAYYPGRRFPAHVYQRVGLLERILEDLATAHPAQASAERAGG